MMPSSSTSLALAPMTPPAGMGAPPRLPAPRAAGDLLSSASAPMPSGIGDAPPQGTPPSLALAQSPANPALKVPGKPADANPWQVSSPPPMAAEVAPPAAAASPIPLAAGNATPYASVTANTPGSATDYTNKTIAPGAGVDRLALAQSNWKNFADSTDPEFQAALRETNQAGAASGQLGSGGLRTRLGDLGLARTRDLEHAKTGFLNDATSGSIEDNYRNLGIAQQQQGFQSDQQKSAFDQWMQQQQLEEYLRSGKFGRSATTLGLGNSGNPSDTALQLSGIYGKQSSDAGSSAGDLLKNSSYLAQLLAKQKAGEPNASPYDVNDPNQNIYAGIK